MNPNPPVSSSLFDRTLSGLLAVFWLIPLSLLLVHAPPLGKLLGFVWAGLALGFPRIYLLSLVALLPLFGNNPGGPHHLYLLEVGMMGYVIRRFAQSAVMPTASPNSDALQSLLAVSFLGFSTGAMVPQLKRILCEIQVEGTAFLLHNYSHYGNSPVFGIHTWTCLALTVAFYSCVRRENAGSQARAALIWTMLGAALVASIIGLLEYAQIISLSWWRADNPMITRFGYRRLQSLFWHSGWFAQYLAAIAPASLALALITRGRSRIIAAAVYLTLGLTELFTLQRGAWLGFVAGSGAVGLGFLVSSVPKDARSKFVRRGILICVAALSVILLASLAHAPLRNRMMEMAKVSDRSGLWGGAWEIGMLRPMAGAGFGNYTTVHQWRFNESSPYFTVDDKTTAHNLPLHIFAERGALTAICFLLLLTLSVTGVFWSILRGASSDSPPDAPRMVERLAVFGGLTAIAVDGIFQYSFYLRVTEIVFWLLIAWAGRCFFILPSSTRVIGSAWFRAICLLLCAATVVLFVRDYFIVDGSISHESEGWFITRGRETEIDIPQEGTRFAVRVFSYDPLIAQGEPLTFAFWFDESLVATHVFTKYEPADVQIFLPPDRKPDQRLKIIASRVWNPYIATNRIIGRLEAGVCYKDFRSLDAGDPSSERP